MAHRAEFEAAMKQVAKLMSVAEMTRRSGLNRSTIREWMGGNAPRDARKLVTFCERLELPEKLRQALMQGMGIPVRLYDFDDELEVPLAGLPRARQEEDTPSLGEALAAARDFWLEERRHALGVLDHLMHRTFVLFRDYLEWCVAQEVEPQLPEWKTMLSLALSHADQDEVDRAIDMAFEVLRARSAHAAAGSSSFADRIGARDYSELCRDEET